MKAPGYLVILVLSALLWHNASGQARQSTLGEDTFRAMVEADWAAQESRKGRTAESIAAVRDAHQRAQRLCEALRRMPQGSQVIPDAAALEALQSQVDTVNSLDKETRLHLYQKIRSVIRDMAIKNPLVASKPVVFMKRRRFICQMLHEYLGYFYDYGDI
ncbi:MAG: hypothetical protein ACYTEK_28870, partial [Planctomycetota bacterium]